MSWARRFSFGFVFDRSVWRVQNIIQEGNLSIKSLDDLSEWNVKSGLEIYWGPASADRWLIRTEANFDPPNIDFAVTFVCRWLFFQPAFFLHPFHLISAPTSDRAQSRLNDNMACNVWHDLNLYAWPIQPKRCKSRAGMVSKWSSLCSNCVRRRKSIDDGTRDD